MAPKLTDVNFTRLRLVRFQTRSSGLQPLEQALDGLAVEALERRIVRKSACKPQHDQAVKVSVEGEGNVAGVGRISSERTGLDRCVYEIAKLPEGR
jgi:hypothetical protein